MSECKTDGSSCETQKECCDSAKKAPEGCTVAEDILCLAKQAKQELLKEKMKKSFEAKLGKKWTKSPMSLPTPLLPACSIK